MNMSEIIDRDDRIKEYIDHEVRIRVQEGIYKEVRDDIRHLENKVDSHFKWILATNITLFATIIIPLFSGIILHMAKLI